MNSPKAAKNILAGKSCYDCRFFKNDKCRYGNLSEELWCDQWDSPNGAHKLRVNWTKESEKDIKAYRGLNVEEELIKAVQTEIDKELK